MDSKRPRVYRHHTHMCFNMCAWCRHTRGRFESKHGGRFERRHALPPSSNTPHTQQKQMLKTKENKKKSSSVLLTKICPRKVITCFRGSPKETIGCFAHFQGRRIGREQQVPDSTNHSLCLVKLLSFSNLERRSGGNQQLDGSVCLPRQNRSITNNLHVTVATPPDP